MTNFKPAHASCYTIHIVHTISRRVRFTRVRVKLAVFLGRIPPISFSNYPKNCLTCSPNHIRKWHKHSLTLPVLRKLARPYTAHMHVFIQYMSCRRCHLLPHYLFCELLWNRLMCTYSLLLILFFAWAYNNHYHCRSFSSPHILFAGVFLRSLLSQQRKQRSTKNLHSIPIPRVCCSSSFILKSCQIATRRIKHFFLLFCCFLAKVGSQTRC